MQEFIHHFTGQCGESHPNLFTLLALTSIIYAVQKIRSIRHQCKKGKIHQPNVCQR